MKRFNALETEITVFIIPSHFRTTIVDKNAICSTRIWDCGIVSASMSVMTCANSAVCNDNQLGQINDRVSWRGSALIGGAAWRQLPPPSTRSQAPCRAADSFIYFTLLWVCRTAFRARQVHLLNNNMPGPSCDSCKGECVCCCYTISTTLTPRRRWRGTGYWFNLARLSLIMWMPFVWKCYDYNCDWIIYRIL